MKIIEQEILSDISIIVEQQSITIIDFLGESVSFDKKGAKQLIEILKEFINENSI